MTTLSDAKLTALETLTGNTGHVNDLEQEYLLLLVTGPVLSSTIDGLWDQVFTEAAIPAGQFNDRAVQYIKSIHGAPPSEDYNAHWQFYWEQGGTPIGPVVAPPSTGTLIHWFDVSDPATVFQDVAGTIAAADGLPIRHMTNKGISSDVITQPGAAPIYQAGELNGLAVAENLAAPEVLSGTNMDSSAALSVTFAVIFKSKGVDGEKPFHWFEPALNENSIQIIASGNFQTRYNGGNEDSNEPVVADQWTWVLGSILSLTFVSETAGGTIGFGPSSYNQISAGPTTMDVGGLTGQWVETLVWFNQLSVGDRAAFAAYVDAKYGASFPIAPPTPPFFANLQHWFDFDDPSTMFSDSAGLNQINPGEEILRIENKGSDGQPIIEASVAGNNHNPLYIPDALNGFGVAHGPHSPANVPDLGVGNPLWLSAGAPAGIAMFLVTRKSAPSPGFLTNSRWTSLAVSAQIGQESSTTWRGSYSPSGTVNTLKTIVNNEWTWHYLTVGPGGTLRIRASGAVEVTSPLVYAAVSATGGPFNIALTKGDTAELLIYDREFTPAELTTMIAYVDGKYGVMPFVAPEITAPPAIGSLVHHVDPTDASTVWFDAAGTIPAVNGGTVDRIDNKGYNGTPLASVTGSPIYRTGVLNGENVIEFSGANLTALAVAAGLTISTTGYTIAMVTRRRASHIGDSILWRWTPFVGSPGPSLRGFFALDGNFHRATPIIDEQLVANPSTLDAWYLIFLSNDAAGAGDDSKYGSPGPEVAGPFGVATDIAPGSDVRYGTSSTLVQHAEAWFWDRPLTSAERDQLIGHADAKYGTLPHL